MLRALRTFPLLDGFRGAPKADLAAVEDIVMRVAALASEHPEIVELDCNPVIAGRHGATITDARVRLEAAPSRRPPGALDRP
jgi:acyl-CoA synthetase (NDP forming)